jgi:hypothetical protein
MQIKLALFVVVVISTLTLILYVKEVGKREERERTRNANREAADSANDRRSEYDRCTGMFDYWTGRCEGAQVGDGE